MSILVRLKNKLQDPSLYETKIREFDECMLLLKTENVELHKRIDQLEALYKTSMRTHHTHFLEEHIRQLEQENERLFFENQCQRQEYERFLDQLTTMVIRTAVMQENIRKECASIYHIIERLSFLTVNAIETKHPFGFIIKDRKKSLSWENLNKSCELISNFRKLSKLTEDSIHSSSSSSSTTHRSISTPDSWTHDLPFDNKDTKNQMLISNKPTEEEQQVLQRSETFIISKVPQEELSSSGSITADDYTTQHQPITRTIAPITLTNVRPSRLPSCCSNSKIQSSNNNRSLSTQKMSKLPIRKIDSLNQQQNSIKKSNIPTSIGAKTKNDVTSVSNRSTTSANNNNNIITKKTIRPPSIIQLPSYKFQSRSTTIPDKNNTKTTTETIKSNDPIQQMNSTSSESSIEEQQHIHKFLSIVQDDGYSTWSSIDVKDDRITNSIKKNETNDQQRNIGLITTWLDTSKRKCSNKSVNEEFENNKHEDSSSYLHPFVHDCYSNDTSISTTISSSNKDMSLDSLDSPQSKEQTILSSTTFSRSETFDKVFTTTSLPNITDDIDDSASSSSSTTFNLSEYIEDHFIDENDSSSNGSENSSSYETTIINKNLLLKPQKRLLFPGLLNRLIFSRRILSESDLQQKKFFINENENQFHVYHSNIINEHSVEINLMNTYGSDSELHVWSNNCAEQRKFLFERQQQQQQQLTNRIEENKVNHGNYNQQLALERQILLQQIYEYPWLLQENDLDRTTILSSTNMEQPLASSSSDLIVPTHNPNFYQLCTLTHSSSFVISTSLALLISTENRVASRNLTCQHDLPLMTTISTNCEACLITSRNYIIETKLSLTGSGPEGFSYTCLQVNEVEAYRENLIRECRYFPRNTLNGYDDFCIASPYSYLRGSYRACICTTNTCNFNYAQCIRQISSYLNQKASLFSNTIVELTDKIKCYRSNEDIKQETSSSLTPSLCSDDDNECKNYLFDHGVLCMISIDRTNRITRQTLVPSIYSAYLIKYKTELCNSFISTTKSIYFSQCKQDDIVCMCAYDGCDKDLETCRTNQGIPRMFSLSQSA
ncbi:unnamed protein product [Rotaria sordida]|uniref:Uncharacterized protein n=2 Tax=Rotaria sordida TaxID=392033 RepID=A0A818R7U7_9BILA|nr:unnamed protein product [Rotaria sordida]